MTGQRHIAGRYYPTCHPGWGAFGEELFFYTSRYYPLTEAFLRRLAARPDFSMSGYRAERLSEAQRAAMAAVLSHPPSRESGRAVAALVEAVIAGKSGVPDGLVQRFPPRPGRRSPALCSGHRRARHCTDAGALDPLFAMAQRLGMAVAVRDHHVELDLHRLAEHLDSENPAIRNNLQQCVLDLHNAGYRLRHHPHLTHAEARRIGEEGAV